MFQRFNRNGWPDLVFKLHDHVVPGHAELTKLSAFQSGGVLFSVKFYAARRKKAAVSWLGKFCEQLESHSAVN